MSLKPDESVLQQFFLDMAKISEISYKDHDFVLDKYRKYREVQIDPTLGQATWFQEFPDFDSGQSTNQSTDQSTETLVDGPIEEEDNIETYESAEVISASHCENLKNKNLELSKIFKRMTLEPVFIDGNHQKIRSDAQLYVFYIDEIMVLSFF